MDLHRQKKSQIFLLFAISRFTGLIVSHRVTWLRTIEEMQSFLDQVKTKATLTGLAFPEQDSGLEQDGPLGHLGGADLLGPLAQGGGRRPHGPELGGCPRLEFRDGGFEFGELPSLCDGDETRRFRSHCASSLSWP